MVGGDRGGAARPALSNADIDDRLGRLLASRTLRDAAATLSAETGLPRRQLYARALALSQVQTRKGCAADP